MQLEFVSLDFKDADERLARTKLGGTEVVYQTIWDWALEGGITKFTTAQAVRSILSNPFVDVDDDWVEQRIQELIEYGLIRRITA